MTEQEQDNTDAPNNATGSDERYVCPLCKEMVPGHPGEITVPNGTNAPVWCPWCGDEMGLKEEISE